MHCNMEWWNLNLLLRGCTALPHSFVASALSRDDIDDMQLSTATFEYLRWVPTVSISP